MLLKGSEQGSEMEEEGILLALKGIPLGSIFFLLHMGNEIGNFIA